MTDTKKDVKKNTEENTEKKARKVTIVLPEETLESLKTLSTNKGVTMSSIATASIEYFKWLNAQKADGFKIKAVKTEGDKVIEKEITII